MDKKQFLTASLGTALLLPIFPTSANLRVHDQPTFVQSPALAKRSISSDKLQALVEHAKQEGTSQLVILEGGNVVVEYHRDGQTNPIHIMSVTKAIVNLAIGRLLFEGKIRSLDQPVHEFFPEWKQGKKRTITLRHLLNHTSGLQELPNAGIEIEPSPDIVQLALAADLTNDPGTFFQYNNKAVNLLPEIVRRASGKEIDAYLADTVFARLGIREFKWLADSSGHKYGMAGLFLCARDLAKVGQLMLSGGQWGGSQVVSKEWVAESIHPANRFFPRSGLLWWVVPEWTKYTVDESLLQDWRTRHLDPRFISKMEGLRGKLLGRQEFLAELDRLFGAGRGEDELFAHTRDQGAMDARRVLGPAIGFESNGWLGQYLVVIPDLQLVAVRLIDGKQANDKTQFGNFIESVLQLRDK